MVGAQWDVPLSFHGISMGQTCFVLVSRIVILAHSAAVTKRNQPVWITTMNPGTDGFSETSPRSAITGER